MRFYETGDSSTPLFPEMNSDQLEEVLGLTIKHDRENKIVTFLCQLLAYTEDSQINVCFNAPSSTGKSYIPLEVARLFPVEDVMEIAYCSPTAFFHDKGEYQEEGNQLTIDLSRKILIFLDQPHMLLLEHLRPLFSHDKKELQVKITDKSQKAGLRTKNVLIIGYPAVVFCTTNSSIDEQESTRFFLLSPETSEEKIRASIHERLRRASNRLAYQEELEADPNRRALMDRIVAIKSAQITDIRIASPEVIEHAFMANKRLQPRHQRDVGRLISLIKSFALFNYWHRERDGDIVIASEGDIEEGFKIWDRVSTSQEFNLPPYVYGLYQEIICPLIEELERDASGLRTSRPIGVLRQQICERHARQYGRPMAESQLRLQILPMLETAGLIYQVPDENDRRRMLVCRTTDNSELAGGVSDQG